MLVCSVMAGVFGTWGIAGVIKEITVNWHVPDDWPPSGDFIFSFLFYTSFFVAGAFSLIKMRSNRRRDESASRRT